MFITRTNIFNIIFIFIFILAIVVLKLHYNLTTTHVRRMSKILSLDKTATVEQAEENETMAERRLKPTTRTFRYGVLV